MKVFKLIKECKGNQRTVFGVNKVLHLNRIVLPKIIKSNKDMAHDFNNFLYQKITNMHRIVCSAHDLWKHLSLCQTVILNIY